MYKLQVERTDVTTWHYITKAMSEQFVEQLENYPNIQRFTMTDEGQALLIDATGVEFIHMSPDEDEEVSK